MRAEWAEHHRAEAKLDGRAWESERPAFQHTYRRWAARMVDALGDLLPTGVDVQYGWTDRDPSGVVVHREPAHRRYVTDWQELNA
ncbi:hypothetical protein [Nocardia thailandica]|uniref:hypothetical protein n=1 Tax=Nocardia thailandica TaxID=257275 RepID=UPI000310F8EF|nr:hypothetical protein [Nocardia thailandica]